MEFPMTLARILGRLVGVACLVCVNADAADISAHLAINRVTVYRESATVARRGAIELPAGDHRLVLRGLPDATDPATLRLFADDPAVRLGSIELQRIVDTKFAVEAEQQQRKKLTDLQDQKTALEDTIATAQTQLKLLDAIAESPNAQAERPAVDGATLNAVLSTIGASATEARAAVRAAKIKLRALDEQVAAVEAELKKVQTQSKATTELRATIGVRHALTVPVTVEYQVKDAGWEWLYEARLDSRTSQVAIFKQAAVRQGTGEDWTNVELSVTTSRPLQDAATPAISSLFVDLIRPDSDRSFEEIVVTGLRSSRGSSRRRSDDKPMPEEVGEFHDVEVSATEFIADYRIPGRVSVSADRQTRVYPVGEVVLDVDLVARAVLYAERSARLEAKFTYAADMPLDAGRVQLFRDDAFVGFAVLPLILPGADVRMPFGVDERIRITMHEEGTGSGRRGVLNNKRADESKRTFEITSFHATAMPIEVIHRIPVAKNSDIKVEVLDGATPPTVQDLDGRQGVYLWRLTGEPRKAEKIRHYYSVRYPRGYDLDKSE
jgi:uncharacterized protein (TIGR02231 family)